MLHYLNTCSLNNSWAKLKNARNKNLSLNLYLFLSDNMGDTLKILELSLSGVIKEIIEGMELYGNIQTTLKVECDPKEIKNVEEKVKKIEEKFRYNPFQRTVNASNSKIRDLTFLGHIHHDVIGKPFKYELEIMNPFADNVTPEYFIISELLVIDTKDLRRIYSSLSKRNYKE